MEKGRVGRARSFVGKAENFGMEACSSPACLSQCVPGTVDYDGQAIDPTAKGRPEEFPQRVVMLIQQERRRHGIQAHD